MNIKSMRLKSYRSFAVDEHVPPEATVKEFRAICPVTKFMTTRVYSRATAGNARRFLMDLLEDAALPPAVHPGRRRQRAHAPYMAPPVRERLRATPHPAARPAAAKTAVQRQRRTGQSLGTDRVLEPLRRPADHQAGRPTPSQLRILLQLPAPSCIAGLPDVQRIHCRLGGRLVPVPKVLSRFTVLPAEKCLPRIVEDRPQPWMLQVSIPWFLAARRVEWIWPMAHRQG